MDRSHSQIEDDKKKLQLTISRQSSQEDYENVHQKIPEIKDIYDSIYGIVQSKLEFYENKNGRQSPKPTTPVRSISYDHMVTVENLEEKRMSNELNAFNFEVKVDPTTDSFVVNSRTPSPEIQEQPLTPPVSSTRKPAPEPVSNPDLLSNCSVRCIKCEAVGVINDRTEILTDINTNLKVELEYVKQNLKKEIERNNELNFEIANIEAALEQYYKEAKHQKSTISSIYSTVKNYSSNKSETQERYTFRRIKAISDYVETLKLKLQHQDRIIKDNFLENPYSTDMMMKYDAVRQQLDKVTNDNQDLKNEIKKKQEEEIEIIKELNRQKFKIEEKSREIENHYKNELASKDIKMANLQGNHDRQTKEINDALEKKIEEMSKLKAVYEAKISNYEEELVVIYRKLRIAGEKV